MVEDDSREVTAPCGISYIVDILFLSTTNTNETHNDIVTIGAYSIVTNSYTWTGSRLSENSRIGTNSEIFF